jgi:hypothetical protein|tara:strand:+ start:72 stop:275 length:204 start_codon:yes stop_codon:yes gene_type:complete
MDDFKPPKHITTEGEWLFIALTQIENVAKLTEENAYKNYIYAHLSPIKYELERQLTNYHATRDQKTT